MERRKFPRRDMRGTPFRATLVLTGGSLLNKDSFSAMEIETCPINLSQGGMSVSLDLDAVWATFSPEREVELHLDQGGERESRIRARVVHVQPGEHVLGLEFADPLEEASPLLH